MCGIAGLLSLDKDASCEAGRIQASSDAQAHRGPDDSDLQVLSSKSPLVIFGHRRLSIIDTSSAGRQPMRDNRTGNWIIFNGEIYNFKDLRVTLGGRDEFITQTDTEVILKAYAAWGRNCVDKLRGIFAFAIWDYAGQTLFCARDQLGVKPFYYWQKGNYLVFASEVRALLATELVPRHLALEGLHSYLAYGSVQESLTLVKDVKSLPPGHTLQWKNGKTRTRQYWQLPKPLSVRHKGLSDITTQIRQRMEEALNLQLIADVPLGAFLSGGIDSTCVAAMMQKGSVDNIKTFAVVYHEAEYDERKFSRIAAQWIGTDHSELTLTGEMVKAELPRALAAFDQPSMDGLNTYFVSKMTRKAGIKVALSGLGGDELFGGYSGYAKTLQVMRWGRRLDVLPRTFRLGLGSLMRVLPQREVTRKLAAMLEDDLDFYFVSRRVLSAGQVRMLLRPELMRTGEEWYPDTFYNLISSAGGFDPVNFASAMELRTYLLSTLLRDTDQMSMAHSLEVRVPLIDHEIVEFMFGIPGAEKTGAGQPKPLLTRAFKDLIPSECIFRPKRGFTLPLEYWLRDSLRSDIEDCFLDSHSDVFSQEGLKRLWTSFQRGTVSWSRVWMIFVLRSWLTRHRIVLN